MEEQRKSLEQRHREEVLRYVENVRVLESQALDNTHRLMAAEDARRKLQVAVDQSKSEIEYLAKSNVEAREAK